jgi:hypothetical protein
MAAQFPTPMETQRVGTIVWAFALLGVPAYLAGGWLISDRIPALSLSPAFGVLLSAAALLAAGFTLKLRNDLLVNAIRDGRLDTSTAEGAATFLRVSLICWVLAESIAVMGLVWALWSRSPGVSVPFVLVSLALFAIHSPRFPRSDRPAAPATDPRPLR